MFPIIIFPMMYGKDGFAEKSKNLDIDLKIILLEYQNNYVRCFN